MRNSMIALILLAVILLSGYVLVLAQDGGPSADQLAQRARIAYRDGDLNAAIDLYAEALRLAPQNADYVLEYTRMLIYGSYADRDSRHLTNRALDVAQDALNTQPKSPPLMTALALALTEQARLDEAKLAAQRAVELDPMFAPAHVALSLVYRTQNDWQQAQLLAEQAVDLAPDNIDAHRALALAYAFTGDFEAAISEYQVAIDLHPKLDVLYFELAPYYIDTEDFDAALALYDDILERHPDNVKANVRTCEIYFRQRDDAAALTACNRAIELDPTNPGALRQLGMIRYTSRDYNGAVESFAECVLQMKEQGWDTDSQYEQCYYVQGLAYQLLDQCESAEPLFQQALDLENLSEQGRELTYAGMEMCGVTSTGSQSTQIIEPGEVVGCTPNEAWFVAPVNGQLITEPTTLVGTAAMEDFQSYHVEIRQDHPDIVFSETSIRGDAPIINGYLGEFAPSQFLAGRYRLRLVVKDTENMSAASCEITIFIGDNDS